MATTVLNAADIIDFEVIPYPRMAAGQQKVLVPSSSTSVYHSRAGDITFNNTSFPHLHIMDLHWVTPSEEMELYDSTPTDCININFMTSGQMYSRFKGLSHDLDMQPLRHNLIYLPERDNSNLMKKRSTMSMLHLTFDKGFFTSAIGQDDAWSERILNELHHQRPFSGVTGTGAITPQMLQLVDAIRNCPGSGPLRNLLIQSKALELLALQIEQFKSPAPAAEAVRPHDAEKLYQLKTYLDTNFLSELSLSQLSRQCLLNEFKLKKGFKELFGTTVFNYIRKLRMEHAGKLLKDCSLTVEEVAEALGYEHAQHFSHAFRKYAGTTPSHFRTANESRQVLV